MRFGYWKRREKSGLKKGGTKGLFRCRGGDGTSSNFINKTPGEQSRNESAKVMRSEKRGRFSVAERSRLGSWKKKKG